MALPLWAVQLDCRCNREFKRGSVWESAHVASIQLQGEEAEYQQRHH
jgi:hypothetical protein